MSELPIAGETATLLARFFDRHGQPMAATGVAARYWAPGATAPADVAGIVPIEAGTAFEITIPALVDGGYRVVATCTGPEPAVAQGRFTVAKRLF